MWNKIRLDIFFGHRRIQNHRTSHRCALGTISIRQKWTFISIESISWSEGSKRAWQKCVQLSVSQLNREQQKIVIKDVLNMERRCEIRKLTTQIDDFKHRFEDAFCFDQAIHSIPFCSTFCSLTLIRIIIGDTASIIQYDFWNRVKYDPF